jgi:outer membrane receptor protein involved in Fe transport
MNRFILMLSLLPGAINAFAKEPISGIVVDNNSDPIEFATILKLSADSTVIESTTSNSNGLFKLTNAPNAKFIKVSYIGFNNQLLNIPLKSDTIRLVPSQEQLNEVVVSARRKLTKRIDNGISYDMSMNKRAQHESLLQALRYVPMLDVALDGTITVKGNSSYRIFLNGRSYDMAQSNPQQVLQSIAAKSIKKIEVITEPSEAFGNSQGEYIINIVTDKDALDGFYINTTLQGNTQPSTSDGIMIMGKKKSVDFSLSYNYNLNGQHNQPVSQEITTPESTTYLKSKGNGNWQTHLVRAITDIRIDSVNTIYADLHTRILRTDITGSWQQYTSANPQISNMEQINHDVAGTIETNVLYRNYFKNRPNIEHFSLGYRYTHNPDKHHFINTIYSDNDTTVNTQQTDGSMNEHTIRGAMYQPLAKYHSLRIIAKQVFRDGCVESSDDNNIAYNQSVSRLTAYYSGLAGDWSFYALLAGENDHMNMRMPLIGESNKRNEFHLLPQVGAQWNANSYARLTAQYSRSITRPGLAMLNPFYNVINNSTASQGNPNLSAEVNDNLSVKLLYMRSNFFCQTGINGAITKNAIFFYQKGIDSEGKLLKTYDNIGKNKNIGIDLFANWQPWSFSSFSTYLKASYGNFSAKEMDLNQNFWTCYANISADFYLPKNWNIQGRYSLSKQTPALWGTVNIGHRYSLKIEKSLLDGCLNIGVEANSPFAKYSKLEQHVTKPTMQTTQTNYLIARSFGIYLSYTFRKGKSVNVERNNTLKTTDQQTGVE